MALFPPVEFDGDDKQTPIFVTYSKHKAEPPLFLFLSSDIRDRISGSRVARGIKTTGVLFIKEMYQLSVVNHLRQFYRRNDNAVLVNSHVTGSDFINQDNFAVVVTELELDVPKVKTDAL